MKRVAEIIYIIEPERESFLKEALNLNEEEKKRLWLCGVRKQQYFALNDLIFMTFEYEGNDFNGDMVKMANYLDSKGVLIKKRRKDVPVSERQTTNWWAPVKRIGSVLDEKPFFEREILEFDSTDMFSGYTGSSSDYNDISFSEEDWIDDFHI